MSNTTELAAQLIEATSPLLALAWRERPWLRVRVAKIYARRLNADPSSDPHPNTVLVLDVAMNDAHLRELEADLAA